jgi:hypothetical protein
MRIDSDFRVWLKGTEEVPAQRRIKSAECPDGDCTAHEFSPEIVVWLHQLSELDAIRTERVRAVMLRLQRGAYQTESSAERTADAILDGIQ